LTPNLQTSQGEKRERQLVISRPENPPLHPYKIRINKRGLQASHPTLNTLLEIDHNQREEERNGKVVALQSADQQKKMLSLGENGGRIWSEEKRGRGDGQNKDSKAIMVNSLSH